jgi:hypothetical protein
MSELKDIVPPLELCKLIPAKEFEDSVLVWKHHEIFFRGIDIMDQTDRVTFRADEQNNIVSTYSSTRYYPAPTLAEILDELGNKTVCLYDGIRYEVSVCIRERDSGTKEHRWRQYGEADRNPAAAALRLWLKVKVDGNE